VRTVEWWQQPRWRACAVRSSPTPIPTVLAQVSNTNVVLPEAARGQHNGRESAAPLACAQPSTSH
jgi:hypothetical protein